MSLKEECLEFLEHSYGRVAGNRRVGEYYRNFRDRGCFFTRAMCSLLVPIWIAWWILPFYQKLYKKADFLTDVREDWQNSYFITDLQMVNASLYLNLEKSTLKTWRQQVVDKIFEFDFDVVSGKIDPC